MKANMTIESIMSNLNSALVIGGYAEHDKITDSVLNCHGIFNIYDLHSALSVYFTVITGIDQESRTIMAYKIVMDCIQMSINKLGE